MIRNKWEILKKKYSKKVNTYIKYLHVLVLVLLKILEIKLVYYLLIVCFVLVIHSVNSSARVLTGDSAVCAVCSTRVEDEAYGSDRTTPVHIRRWDGAHTADCLLIYCSTDNGMLNELLM